VLTGDLFYRVSVFAPGAVYDLSADLSSLSIEQRETYPDLLLIHLSDPHKVLGHALQEGMGVEVELGTADDHSVIFRGRIYRVEGSFPQAGVPTLTLRAFDRSMEMGLRKRNRVWADMNLSDLVSTLAVEYFNRVSVELRGDPKLSGNGLRQKDETDLAFLLRLARQHGCVMYVKAEDDDEVLYFVAEHVVMTTESAVTLFYGRCGAKNQLVRFESSADVVDIQLPRILSGIDARSGQLIEAKSAEVEEVGTTEDPFFDENLTAFRTREPVKAAGLELLLEAAGAAHAELRQFLGGVERIQVPTFTTEEALNLAARNQFSTRLRGMRGSGTAPGQKDLLARTSVQLADVGGRFSGTWYLAEVRHELNREGYHTHFECRR